MSNIIGTQGRVSNNPFKAYFAVEGINSEERNVRDRLLSARTDNTNQRELCTCPSLIMQASQIGHCPESETNRPGRTR
jgi:hypothetical protein